jgi:Protein of unknown function (DUF2849)
MKVLTANRLKDGIAVWYTGTEWSENIAHAQSVTAAEQEAQLAEIGASAALNNEVVDVNLIEVSLVEGILTATRLREQIRSHGPSINYIK